MGTLWLGTARGRGTQCQLHQAEGEDLERATWAGSTQDDVGLALSKSCAYSDTIILSKAAKILRHHMLDHKILTDVIYNMDSTEEVVPPSLLQFVGMVDKNLN